MVYHKKFVVSLKCNGNILREYNGEEVYLPFGSTYSIILKNLNSVSCKVKIFIDGNSVLDNHELIINANETIEIERFIKNNNLNQGNKFKFIEKTSEIENFRGNQLEDGLIKIDYQFEKITYPLHVPAPLYGPQPYYIPPITCNNYHSNPILRAVSYSSNSNDGITVPGGISNQEFSVVTNIKQYELNPDSIILKLKGQSIHNTKIEKPITVKDNPICSTCGRKNKQSSKFCPNCGTSLVIL